MWRTWERLFVALLQTIQSPAVLACICYYSKNPLTCGIHIISNEMHMIDWKRLFILEIFVHKYNVHTNINRNKSGPNITLARTHEYGVQLTIPHKVGLSLDFTRLKANFRPPRWHDEITRLASTIAIPSFIHQGVGDATIRSWLWLYGEITIWAIIQ